MGRVVAARTLGGPGGRLKLYPEVLSERQRSLLPRIARAVDGGDFYLAGGTAVALRIGHRVSVDLDWFTSEKIGDPLRLVGHLRGGGIEPKDVTTDEGTLHATIEGVRNTFLEYHYPLLRELDEWTEVGCRLASLEDLGCTKLAAIAGSGARRDFIDLHAIMCSGLTLSGLFDAYGRKFGLERPEYLLRSLVYFDEAEAEAMPRVLSDVQWPTIREDLEREVRRFVEGA